MTKGVLTRIQPAVLEMLEQLRLPTEKTPNDVVKRLVEKELKVEGKQ